MPFIGLTPFLPQNGLVIVNATDRVNALHRAYSISTREAVMLCLKEPDVSMPFIGLTPFLHV